MPVSTRCLASDAKRFVVALAAVVVLLVLLPGGAFAAEKGLETDMTWGTSSTTQQRTADLMADVGSQWVRLDMSWADVETSRGARNSTIVAQTDRAVQMSRAKGIKIILVVANAPGWASGTSNKSSPPQNPADYANFLSWVVNRYRGQIEAYEVWNEQNTTRFWPAGVNPGQYANLLKAAYPAVKAADSAAKVLFGGLSFNDYDFVEGAYAAAPDLGQYFDVMATHPYTGSFPGISGAAPPEHTATLANGRLDKMCFPSYRELRATMAAHGGAKPIWFTEFGWSTETGDAWGVSEAVQADYLTRALRYVEQDPYVQVAITYNFRNNYWANNANNWEDSLGLMRTDWTPKPAYNAFKTYTPGSGPAPTPDPDPTPAPAPTNEPTPTTTQPTSTTSTSKGPKKKTRTTLRVSGGAGALAAKAATNRASRLSLNGVVADATAGRVRIRLQRLAGAGRGSRTVVVSVRLSRAGRFATRVVLRGSGRWRVQALYGGSDSQLPSTSRFAYFRV
jgi:hypothetical protein